MPDQKDGEIREGWQSFKRQIASIGLECLLLVFWILAQFTAAYVLDSLPFPRDAVTTVSVVIVRIMFAALSLIWVGIHAYRELNVQRIRAQIDTKRERERLEHPHQATNSNHIDQPTSSED